MSAQFFNDPHILIHETDHAGVAITRLKSQFIGCPSIEALVRALGAGVQALEEDIFTLIVARTLTASTGAQLDQWGSVVGEARGGLRDEAYRAMINVRALANRTGAFTDELIQIVQLLTEPSTVLELPMYPAGTQFWVIRDTFMSARRRSRVSRTLQSTKGAGIAVRAVESGPGSLRLASMVLSRPTDIEAELSAAQLTHTIL